MTDLEATQEIAPSEFEKEPVSNVHKFPGVPYRITAEAVIRQLLSQVDKIEEIVVVYRQRDKGSLLMNYSSDIGATDLAIGALTLTSLAEARMGLREAPNFSYTTPNTEDPK